MSSNEDNNVCYNFLSDLQNYILVVKRILFYIHQNEKKNVNIKRMLKAKKIEY